MTLVFRIAGVDIGNTRVRLNNLQFSQAADGGIAAGGVTIEDPDGILDIDGWELFEVEETACSLPRTFTGWIYGRNINRGPYRVGAGRVFDCDILDLNAMLHFEPLQKNRDSAARPAETGSQRIAWLMGTLWMDGYVFDNGSVMANAWDYDESDYTTQYPDDVLRDVVSAETAGRWTTFLYWDDTAPAGEEVSLFYGEITSILNTSTLRISNELTDVDSTTTFAPFIDANHFRDPSQQFGTVLIDAVAGRYYRTSASTLTAMALTSPNGLPMRRGSTYTSERLINVATVNRHASTWLDWHADEYDKITCTVRLPASKVNLIQAGMRIECKFEHLPGYETFTFMRVSRRTVMQAPNDDTNYDVQLELSTKGVLQSGGGDPGEFPVPPTSVCGEGGTTLSYLEGVASGSVSVTTGQYVYITELHGDIDWAGTSSWALNFLLDGSPPLIDSNRRVYNWNSRWDGAGTGPHDLYDWECGWTTLPAWTDGDQGVTLTGEVIGVWNGTPHQDATYFPYWGAWGPAPRDGTLTVVGGFDGAATGGGFPGYSATCVVQVSDLGPTEFPVPSAGSDGPDPGQWVYDEVPTPAPGGGRVTFSTAWAFADGSLRVWVDNVEQTDAIVSYDGAAKTFTLAFDPRAFEELLVSYQGR